MRTQWAIVLAVLTAAVSCRAGDTDIVTPLPPFQPQQHLPTVADPFIFLHLVRVVTEDFSAAVPPCHDDAHCTLLLLPSRGDCRSQPYIGLLLWQAKCAGTSLRALLFNKTRDALPSGSVCIPTYTHKFIVLSRGGCGYEAWSGAPKPALLAGHFIWEEYDWMLGNARVRTQSECTSRAHS
jgi:hypothetical protein